MDNDIPPAPVERVQLGPIVSTPGALEALQTSGADALHLLQIFHIVFTQEERVGHLAHLSPALGRILSVLLDTDLVDETNDI